MTDVFYSDQDLLKLINQEDQRAFELLFERYRNSLFTYILKVIKSKESAEEIVLDVFLKLWTGRSMVMEIDNFEAFLFQIARNKAIDFLRWAQKSRFQQMELWNQMQEIFSAETADLKMITIDTVTTIKQAVEALSPQRKRVFQLSREEGLTYEQIARRLQISTNTVRNHLTASLQFIRGHLSTELKLILFLFLLPS